MPDYLNRLQRFPIRQNPGVSFGQRIVKKKKKQQPKKKNSTPGVPKAGQTRI